VTHQELFNLAVQKQTAGQLAEAEALYRQLLAGGVAHLSIYNNLGGLLCQMGRFADAVGCYRQALELQPNHAEMCRNLGNALRASGEVDQAIDVLQKGLLIRPDQLDLLGNLGMALMEKHRFAEAIECYSRAIAIKPDLAAAHFNLGVAQERVLRRTEAIASYRRTILLEPRFARAYSNLGGILQSIGQTDEAVAACRKAIELEPEFADAHSHLGTALFNSGFIDAATAAYARAAELAPGRSDLASNCIFILFCDPNFDFSTILPRCAEWNRRFADPVGPLVQPHASAGPRGEERRARVGYISSYFRAHAEGAFILPLLEHHNREEFEIFCYSDTASGDAVTQRLRRCVDVWRDTGSLGHAALAERICADGIDILVDLVMHMPGSRLEALARRPAAVQAAYLAYPGTTGVPTMDYRLTDSFLDPPGQFEDHYSEVSIRLSRTFACYDPAGMEGETAQRPPDEAETALPPAHANGYVTFGCMNNISKVNSAVLARWSGVLKAIPSSRLRLLAPEGESRRFILDCLSRHGVESGRVDFVSKRNRSEYLKDYRRIDICLDTLPYCGHTTSLDGLWMGVPVVTQTGRTAVGRQGWSVLNNLQLTELAADHDEEFVKIAAGLASDLPRLTDLRRTLRRRLIASPIMDAAEFARDVEAAYRRMTGRES
jgi:predicted O-linked N-acetylglucosamine transferase (SPINDLY family)